MPLKLTRPLWGIIRDIHWQARTGFDYRADIDLHGKQEYWCIPDDKRPEGDCEDFALWCSQKLIKQGIAWEHQVVAYCLTETGGAHLVLMINTDRGVYILDNRQDSVKGYADLASTYHFIAQSQWGKPMDQEWVRIEDV
ncbi:transglutaminase-like cysteine peptidase [Thalassospira sp. MCCC 1A01428]|uniref:transglutaminase-like cysteine peptidase n=1 Tax=Thalassospira sp. MCCC 1A01428 TaxID=1470575 RepID=UPI000A1DE3C4|nr:transglutaminase-like cysteine peptidase [Thalassospira sp. MCCC 1A01428]OSQ45529.1 hypothetical protein THS27_04135 [Thalassospira sp. MCCC 1A01428]